MVSRKGIHRLSLSIPIDLMEAMAAKVPPGELTAYIVRLIQRDVAKRSRP